VRAAIINSHFEFPARRITVNLAPADLPKEGGRYDLPIALGILAATGQICDDLPNWHYRVICDRSMVACLLRSLHEIHNAYWYCQNKVPWKRP